MEDCALCNTYRTKLHISKDVDLPLCEQHWNGWCYTYVGNTPPCAAHLIGANA